MAIKYTKSDDLEKKLAEFIVDMDIDQEENNRRTKIAEEEAAKFIELEDKAREKKDEK